MDAMSDSMPERVRRFVLTSLPTVPHLETLLLLWRESQPAWNAEQIASRLYVSPAIARIVADELTHAELIESDGAGHYRSRREPRELAELLDELDAAHARQLRAITDLIHSNTQRKATRFADAFSWRKT
jgi:Mn-dependent DtxR family transcriptional regulator